jgi:hypothetical protein
MDARPTIPELNGKINNAIEALKSQRCDFGTLRHWPEDSEALELDSAEELWPLIQDLLQEIKDAKPEKCYTGTRPPQRCYQDEPTIKKQELWAFSWDSAKLGKRMYLKFVLKKNQRGEWHYFHIDCHLDAPKD